VSTPNFERFGKYLLLEKLATGGMAEVFLARSSGTSGIAKFFAIKRILPQYAESPEFIEMFKDEAKIAINLNHSNIVSIHEFGMQNKQFFLVMDYVEGRNLRQILNKMKKTSLQFSIDQIVYMVKEIAGGLDHAHRCLDANTGKPLNITHRDMSPQNVMVSFEGEVKIVDFGIAKAESQMENTRAGTLKGKFGYMSPEQAEGQPIDLRTDIFSLGIVLWELLANDRLFSANNELNTLRKIRDCQIPSLRKINPNIHAELERICQKALARDRNLRYQTSAAFHRDLNRFLNRQYPDFSPQDFSVFTKSIFADEIMEIRKRLVDYSKLTIGSGDKEESTVVFETKTDSLVMTEGKTAKSFESRVAAEDTSAKLKMDDSAVNHNILDEASLKRETTRRTAGIAAAVQSRGIEDDHDALYRTNTGYRTNRYNPNQTRVKSYPQESSIRGTTIMLFLAVSLGIYSYLVKFHTTTMIPVMRITSPVLGALHDALGVNGSIEAGSTMKPTAPAPTATPPPAAAPPTVQAATPAGPPAPIVSESAGFVMITSTPSGAEVFINKAPIGMITPCRIKVPTDKPFDITLKRTGFSDYKRSNLTSAQLAGHFQAQLDEAHVAYLDIDVIPARRVNISVNGKRLKDSPPFRKVQVPSGVPFHIRIEDPTGNWDEEVMELAQNQHKRITMTLRRKPASE
jgi:eukaryotic-like serine/threonine-protein kinase